MPKQYTINQSVPAKFGENPDLTVQDFMALIAGMVENFSLRVRIIRNPAKIPSVRYQGTGYLPAK